MHSWHVSIGVIFVFLLLECKPLNKNKNPDVQIEVEEVMRGKDENFIWTQARAAFIPKNNNPVVIMTMSQKLKSGSDVYHNLFEIKSQNMGKTWTTPQEIPSLKMHKLKNGYSRSMSDMTPEWHALSQKVINIGKSFYYTDANGPDRARRGVAYAVYDPEEEKWGPYLELKLPQKDVDGKNIMAPVAGCVQFHIEKKGDILLPIFYYPLTESQSNEVNRETFEVGNFMANNEISHASSLIRCSFDGEKLKFLKQGNTLSIKKGRGIYEPSIVKFENEYFLTLRADNSAYVARSKDGLHYEKPVEWKFDDGEVLGSYNTQQHWVNNNKSLYLVYTRKGADNDHIIRHRAPLFIAEVDPEKLVVKKATERVLIPEDGVPLGNFGVTKINQNESWVTTTEYHRDDKPSNKNRVWVAKIRFNN